MRKYIKCRDCGFVSQVKIPRKHRKTHYECDITCFCNRLIRYKK